MTGLFLLCTGLHHDQIFAVFYILWKLNAQCFHRFLIYIDIQIILEDLNRQILHILALQNFIRHSCRFLAKLCVINTNRRKAAVTYHGISTCIYRNLLLVCSFHKSTHRACHRVIVWCKDRITFIGKHTDCALNLRDVCAASLHQLDIVFFTCAA